MASLLLFNLMFANVPSTNIAPEPWLMPWLTWQDKLTDRLEHKAEGVQLQVINQMWVDANHWDSNVLKITDSQVLRREIIITAHNTPCWYALTTIPKSTHDLYPELFARLKKEPVGNLVFNTNSVSRVSLNFYPIEPESSEYSWLDESLHQNSHILWARTSTILVENRAPFYLVEIMLPGLKKYSL